MPGAMKETNSEGKKKKQAKKLECFICRDEHYTSIHM
jgi:hypothetical protein